MQKQTKLLLGALLLGAITLTACKSKPAQPLETVPFVDLQKYAGTWYEIASFPQRFQKGCHCTKAEYKLTQEGYVEVQNSCRKNSVTGPIKEVNGKAFIADSKTNAKLKVQFFWPFKGDYWVIELAEDYSYAVVGHPNREYLWILSRTRQMDQALYQKIIARVAAKGFDISRLQITDQNCS